jgi:hypothetical protein
VLEEKAPPEEEPEFSKEDTFWDSALAAVCELFWGDTEAEESLLTVTLFCALQEKSDKTRRKVISRAAHFAVFNCFAPPPKKINYPQNQWD